MKIKKILQNTAFTFQFSWKLSKGTCLLAIVKIIVDSVQPFVFLMIPKYIIDELTGACRWEEVLKYIILLIATTVFFKLTRLALDFAVDWSTTRCNFKNFLHYAKRFLNMDYRFLEDSSVKNLQEIVLSSVQASGFIWNDYYNMTTNFLKLIGYSYIISTIHPLIIVFIVLVTAAHLVISNFREKANYLYSRGTIHYGRKFNYLFDKMINYESGKEIRINRVSVWLVKKYDQLFSGYMKEYKKNQKKQTSFGFMESLVTFFQTIVMYGYCAYKAITGSITVGSFSVCLGAITDFSSCLVSLIMQLEHFFLYVSRYVDEYRKYMELTTPEAEKEGTVKLADRKSHAIEFVNVSFRYPNTEKYVLKNVSLKINAGEKLAVVGYNGAGKSTFIKLICRLYEPTQGKILYDGTDISEIDLKQYMDLLSVVFQDYKIFAFTLKDNICLNRPFWEEKTEEAVEKSGLAERLSLLENGFETAVSHEFDKSGVELSGGETQKLACARAYYKDGPVIIFDEPTASLDPIAENELYQRFNNIVKNKTAIYISHRLASVKFCDKIAVFAEGRMVEYGTHAGLMQSGGLYADMYSKQAQYYVEESVTS